MSTKRRLTIEFPASANERLETLKKRFDTPTTIEVLKRALSLADYLTEAESKGKSLVITDKDGNQEIIRMMY
jgi:hypothetical protein